MLSSCGSSPRLASLQLLTKTPPPADRNKKTAGIGSLGRGVRACCQVCRWRYPLVRACAGKVKRTVRIKSQVRIMAGLTLPLPSDVDVSFKSDDDKQRTVCSLYPLLLIAVWDVVLTPRHLDSFHVSPRQADLCYNRGQRTEDRSRSASSVRFVQIRYGTAVAELSRLSGETRRTVGANEQ